MKFSSLHLKIFSTLLFIAANAMNQANAQNLVTVAEEKPPLAAPQISESATPFDPQIQAMKRGKRLVIVTSKDPTIKQTCHVASATADEIRCQKPFHKQPTIYRRADLEAIIEPADSHFYWLNFAVFFALGGGIITGACFLGAVSGLAILGAIPIALIGGFLVLGSVEMARDDYRTSAVLYQRAGSKLAIKLP